MLEAKRIHLEDVTGEKANAAEGLREEAAMALTALGISMTDAMKALKKVEITEFTTVEDLLKQGLKQL